MAIVRRILVTSLHNHRIVIPTILMIVGFALAELLLLFLRFFRWFPNAPHGKPYSDEFARSMVVNFVFTNTSFLPMIIIEYLAYSVEPFNSDAENYKILGFAYITIFALPPSILTWVWAYGYIGSCPKNSDPEEHEENKMEKGLLSESISTTALLVNDNKNPEEAITVEMSSTPAQLESNNSPTRSRLQRFLNSQQWVVAKRFITPANSSLLIGLIAGLTPAIKTLFAEGGQLRFAYVICKSIGSSTVPLSNTVLGGSLARGPRNSILGLFLLLVCCIYT